VPNSDDDDDDDDDEDDEDTEEIDGLTEHAAPGIKRRVLFFV
jgi:hypothetical protein